MTTDSPTTALDIYGTILLAIPVLTFCVVVLLEDLYNDVKRKLWEEKK